MTAAYQMILRNIGSGFQKIVTHGGSVICMRILSDSI